MTRRCDDIKTDVYCNSNYFDSMFSGVFQCVLHFMVGSREGAAGVSKDVVDILLRSGLMKWCDSLK